MELPDLNAALVEAYRNLDHTTQAAKEMAKRIKTTQQQAKWATELWQAVEQKLTLLEQQHQDQQPLRLPPPSNDGSPAPLPNPSVGTEAPTEDTTHPRVAMVDASTMKDSVQQPVIETSETSSLADRAPRPQARHTSTQTVPPTVVTTNETSPKTDRTLSLQTRHASTQTPRPPFVMERYGLTDRVPRPRTTQAATDTGPPLRDYQDELKPKSLWPS